MIFTDQQLATLQAAMNRIIPADDYPAAWEAGAGDFLRNILQTDLKHLQETYHAGLDAITAAAQEAYEQDFAQLNEAQQDAVLIQIENTPFFKLLVEHTIEGYYSDPGNGGNKNQIAWQMIGYEVRQW